MKFQKGGIVPDTNHSRNPPHACSAARWRAMFRHIIGRNVINIEPVTIRIAGIGPINTLRALRVGYYQMRRARISPYAYIYMNNIVWQDFDKRWYINVPMSKRDDVCSTRNFKRAFMWIHELWRHVYDVVDV